MWIQLNNNLLMEVEVIEEINLFGHTFYMHREVEMSGENVRNFKFLISESKYGTRLSESGVKRYAIEEAERGILEFIRENETVEQMLDRIAAAGGIRSIDEVIKNAFN